MKMMNNEIKYEKEYEEEMLKTLFDLQKYFQNNVLNKNCPEDNIEEFSNQIVHLISEIGEVTQEDKRWKTNKRVDEYDEDAKERKLLELSDVFIVFINLCLYSGFDVDKIFSYTKYKILENIIRHE